jgi:acetyl-CoA acetyltransferase
MSDDKSKQGSGDRSRVAGGEDYEVEHFANKHDITPDQARDLIKRYGNDREQLATVAAKLRG